MDSPTAEPAFRVVDLVKHYPGRSLAANDGVDLMIESGQVFGILGGNGAGKTSLIRQMLNLAEPTAGRVELFGRDVREDPRWVQSHVGYQAQGGCPLPNLTIRQSLTLTARLRGVTGDRVEAESARLLELLALRPFADRPMSRLSGGEKKLGHIALAMSGAPPILVLDEPTAGLDPSVRRLVWDVLAMTAGTEGITIVLVTHDAVEAERIVRRVALLRQGRIVAAGDPTKLMEVLGQRLRLEVSFDATKRVDLPSGYAWRAQPSGSLVTLLEPQDAARAISELDLGAMACVRMHSATLEDLLVHYGAR